MQTTTKAQEPTPHAPHRRSWLRRTLALSQKEALASSTMTATSDNFFNAYAIFLNASLSQMGWVAGLPQLFGALAQLITVWWASFFHRKAFIVVLATVQAVIIFAMGILAFWSDSTVIWVFIALAVLYHSCMNLIQPHWRAWMGSIVPERRRGTFFASRTRLTMMASLGVFFGGGAILTVTDDHQVTWLGFFLMFLVAAGGRLVSAHFLKQMHDPELSKPTEPRVFVQTLHQFRAAWSDKVFRQYSLFVGCMQMMVAISAPFFAVYMLEVLDFTYLDYVLSSVASILTQFLTLRFWGRFSDQFGNRLVMIVTSCMIPSLPLLWLFSDNFAYILSIQMLSGLAWSGFTLSTANYLYDIRPFRSDFATYAALQASLGAALVFVGAMVGGQIAANAENLLSVTWLGHWIAEPIFVVFLTSSVLRAGVTLWFVPRSVEPKIRPRPKFLTVVFRIARFNAISGVALDWMTVAKRKTNAVNPPSDSDNKPSEN
jgi:MFS family permease